mgnify:CR=1 FL=1
MSLTQLDQGDSPFGDEDIETSEHQIADRSEADPRAAALFARFVRRTAESAVPPDYGPYEVQAFVREALAEIAHWAPDALRQYQAEVAKMAATFGERLLLELPFIRAEEN